MKHGKGLAENSLIRILRTLTREEWKDFGKFTASPFFNKGRNHTPLLEALTEFYPDFRDESLTKEYLYSKLFPGKAYKDSVIKSMLSRLDELAAEFLIQTAFSKNDHLIKERLFIAEASDRGLKERSESLIRKTDKFLSEKKTGVLDFLTVRDYLDSVCNHFVNFNERHELTERLFDYHSNIVCAFLNEYLITEGSIYSQRNFWSPESRRSSLFEMLDDGMIDLMLNAVKKRDPGKYAVLNSFNLLRLAMRSPENDDYYYDIKDFFYSNMDKFDVDFRKFMMNSLSVICTAKSVAGKQGFLMEAHKLRRKIYDDNLYLFSAHKRLRISEFRTAFIEALSLGETEWAEKYFEEYIHKIQPSERVSLTNYCRARLAHVRGDHDSALALAHRVRINQITFKLDMRNLVAQTYYSTESFEPLLSYLDAYSKLLENSRMQNEALRNSHANFVRFLRRLVNLRLKKKDDAESALLLEAVRKVPVSSKKWLMKRIEEQKSAKK